MEENVIIKSKQYNPKKLILALIIIGFLVLLAASIYYGIDYSKYLKELKAYRAHVHTRECYYYFYPYGYAGEPVCGYTWRPHFYWEYFVYQGVIPFASAMLLSFILKVLSSYEMVVTDRRIYGKIVFGRRVDLPIDSISSTGMLRILKGVSASSASGKIRFLLIKNADQMYKEISNLLLNRQNKDTAIVTTSEEKTDTHGDLLKLKELLDMGIITQEEFEAKKKQFLGL